MISKQFKARAGGALLLTCFFCATLAAQAGDVLEENSATSDALIKLLTPEPAVAPPAAAPSVGEPGVVEGSAPSRTRSFKMVRDKPVPKLPPATTSASASLMVTFETDSAKLRPESKKILDNLAQALNSSKLAKFKFNIEGHADPTGLAEKNMKLSEERAQAVLQYLSTVRQVDGGRLVATGKGASEILNRNNPTAPENRRVKIVTITE